MTLTDKLGFRINPKAEKRLLNDFGLEFTQQLFGPERFFELRNIDYGQGFKMATFPEVSSFLSVILREEGKRYDSFKESISFRRKNYSLVGNTALFSRDKRIYVQDNPNLDFEGVVIDERILEDMQRESNDVSYNKDRTIRATRSDFEISRTGWGCGTSDLFQPEKNRGFIALVGGTKNAEELSRSLHLNNTGLFFYIHKEIPFPQVKIPSFEDGVSWTFQVGLNATSKDQQYVSLGVRKIA